ncbi:ABC transporter permease [uncultured Rikenella sp.]|uniref:ABC transporter permease n=1 Tax=uncultured Rikenella sp. TaxID=368003 RepID=UPI0026198537|nr:ABC transporter permease [uncultured Rikenella sp.]
MRHLFGLKSFWNFLRRNKLFTAINIFGFAVSLMFVVLIGLYIQDELRVDRQHEKGERIYRLEHAKGVLFGAPTAPGLEARYSEIEATVRIWGYPGGQLYSPVMEQLFWGDVWYADSTLFDVFSFPFVEGDPHTALQAKNNIVLSESFARKLFGNRSAVGQPVKVSEKSRAEFIVSGVIRDIDRTHFRSVDMIYPMSKLQAEDRMFQTNFDDFGTRSYATYVLTKPGADLSSKTAEMPAFFRELGDPTFVNDPTQTIRLVSLRDIYLHPAIDNTGLFRGNNATFVLILGLTAVLILVFAVINYINLSVAQSGFRAKEAATRRLLGGSRGSLFGGFILESLIICFVSFVLGLLMASSVEPWFREVMQTDISIKENFTTENVLLALAGVLVIGAVSGLVPAFVLTRFQTDRCGTGNVPPSDQNGLQQGLDRFSVLHYHCLARLYDHGDPADELHDEDRLRLPARLPPHL